MVPALGLARKPVEVELESEVDWTLMKVVALVC